MIFLTVPLQYLVGIMAILCGVVAFGYYELKGCDPYKAGYITNMNQVYCCLNSINSYNSELLKKKHADQSGLFNLKSS